jgi:hypothetical protein
MSYTISKTNSNVLVTINDGTINSDYGLVLIGRNYPSYGQAQNDNFVRLLENFASPNPPYATVGTTTIAGTLWWDTGNQILKIYNGTTFIPVSQRTAGAAAPTVYATGDQWWDTANQQLKVWSGSAWILIGPTASATQGKTGAVIEQVLDSIGNPHLVIANYVNGKIISVDSIDSTFTVAPGNANYANITVINPGVTVVGNAYLNGTATNSNTVGGLSPTVFAKINTDNSFQNVYLNGQIGLNSNSATLSYNTGTRGFAIKNVAAGGAIDFVVNNSVVALHIDGTTGLVDVVADPVNPTQIVNKHYVDTLISSLQSSLNNVSTSLNANIGQVASDYFANINHVISSTTTAISTASTAQTTAVTTVVNDTNTKFTAVASTTASLDTRVTSIEGFLPSVAPLKSPSFTGSPTAPMLADWKNSNEIATTSTVYTANLWVQQDYNTKITSLGTSFATALTNAVKPLAPKDSPTFTGTPKAPTQTASDASTAIATTQFVSTAITGTTALWQGSAQFVSGSDPSPGQGNNGDFWFKIG